MKRTRCIVALAWSLLAPVGPSQKLEARIKPWIEGHRGDVAVAIKNLQTGETFLHAADRPMPTASLIKFPAMVEAYRQAESGKIDLDSVVRLRGEDKVPGSGVLTTLFEEGTRFRLRNAVRLMIACSDNTATNLVLDRIGLPSTSATMQQLGFANTRLHSKVYRRSSSIDPERSRRFGLGSTTAAEMIGLLEKLHRGELVSDTASKAMLGHMLACQDRSKLARFLPPNVKLAHKTGAVSGVRCDAGLLLLKQAAIAICVLTARNDDKRWTDNNAAEILCGRIAQAVHRHYAPRTSSEPVPLRAGATGDLVEDLQRTLNERLSPSPRLSVDGDFGPATQEAVRKFQESRKLEVTGVAGSATWKALGPVVAARPVPPPNIVNRAKLETRPLDPLDGPPFVTCKAWVVADAKTGRVLWSANADARLDIASTTKIMTAHIVCEMARESPGVLDETVTFSARADATPGSTAGVRAGERVLVRELLYGLMLPSGNDASVALAEHFGGRCAAPSNEPEQTDPLRRFVAEMNRTAARLGMRETTFRNPHGLTARGHRSSARDLARLAHRALANPLFAGYVRTRQRGCRLIGPLGQERDVLWRNSNQLLATQGYLGVKTGTTRAAGACLVSCCERAGSRLLVVVLGSAATAARYSDTRNLYRWAFRKHRARRRRRV